MIDELLLEGFRFACQPDCGLCCFATPAVSASERQRLVQILPALAIEPAAEGFELIAARGNGGACGLLRGARCRAHEARPFPCREFPLSVHIGDRAQASIVLSCPGIDVSSLGRPSGRRGPPAGLDAERAAVAREAGRRPMARWLREGALARSRMERHLDRAGLLDRPGTDLVRDLTSEIPGRCRSASELPAPPGADAPLESLPIFHSTGPDPLAFRAHPGGWEVVALGETGGITRRCGVYPLPERVPTLTDDARLLLDGYTRYAISRDQFYWTLLAEYGSDHPPQVPLPELARGRVEEIRGQVVARGWIRSRLEGDSARTLGHRAIDAGIRAYDAELVDAPTLGRML